MIPDRGRGIKRQLMQLRNSSPLHIYLIHFNYLELQHPKNWNMKMVCLV